MKNSTGLIPCVEVDAASGGVVSHAGGVALAETARASGLGAELSEALGGWRRPLAVHDPAEVLLDLAVSLAPGGDCLADIAGRGDTRVRPALADPGARGRRRRSWPSLPSGH